MQICFQNMSAADVTNFVCKYEKVKALPLFPVMISKVSAADVTNCICKYEKVKSIATFSCNNGKSGLPQMHQHKTV